MKYFIDFEATQFFAGNYFCRMYQRGWSDFLCTRSTKER